MDFVTEHPEGALEALFIEHLQQRQGSCLMSELGGSSAWKQSPLNTGSKGQMQDFPVGRNKVFQILKLKNGSESVSLVQPHVGTLAMQKNPSVAGSVKGKAARADCKGKAAIIPSFVRHLETFPQYECNMQELAMLPAWMAYGNGCGKLKQFLEKASPIFQVSLQGNSCIVRLTQSEVRVSASCNVPATQSSLVYDDDVRTDVSDQPLPQLYQQQLSQQDSKTEAGLVRECIIDHLNNRAHAS